MQRSVDETLCSTDYGKTQKLPLTVVVEDKRNEGDLETTSMLPDKEKVEENPSSTEVEEPGAIEGVQPKNSLSKYANQIVTL